MTLVRDVIEFMEEWAPSQTAESCDNVGLQTGSDKQKIESIVIALDVTWDTLERTQNLKNPMILSHHPLIFKPLNNLSSDNISNKLIIQALSFEIPIYTSHTNLDQAKSGVSFALAEKIGLKSISPLVPGCGLLFKIVIYTPPEYTDRILLALGEAGAGNIGNYSLCSFKVNGTGTFLPNEKANPFKGSSGNLEKNQEDRLEMVIPEFSVSKAIEAARKVHPYEEMAYDLIPLSQKDGTFGYGAAGYLEKSIKTEEFPAYVTSLLGIESIAYSKTTAENIQTVAVMGGSGSDFIKYALSYRADAFITGEIGHHDYINYGSSIMLIDATHKATELPVLNKIAEKMKNYEKFINLEIIIDAGSPSRYLKI